MQAGPGARATCSGQGFSQLQYKIRPRPTAAALKAGASTVHTSLLLYCPLCCDALFLRSELLQ